MKQCSNCQEWIDESARLCTHCGANLEAGEELSPRLSRKERFAASKKRKSGFWRRSIIGLLLVGLALVLAINGLSYYRTTSHENPGQEQPHSMPDQKTKESSQTSRSPATSSEASSPESSSTQEVQIGSELIDAERKEKLIEDMRTPDLTSPHGELTYSEAEAVVDRILEDLFAGKIVVTQRSYINREYLPEGFFHPHLSGIAIGEAYRILADDLGIRPSVDLYPYIIYKEDVPTNARFTRKSGGPFPEIVIENGELIFPESGPTNFKGNKGQRIRYDETSDIEVSLADGSGNKTIYYNTAYNFEDEENPRATFLHYVGIYRKTSGELALAVGPVDGVYYEYVETDSASPATSEPSPSDSSGQIFVDHPMFDTYWYAILEGLPEDPATLGWTMADVKREASWLANEAECHPLIKGMARKLVQTIEDDFPLDAGAIYTHSFMLHKQADLTDYDKRCREYLRFLLYLRIDDNERRNEIDRTVKGIWMQAMDNYEYYYSQGGQIAEAMDAIEQKTGLSMLGLYPGDIKYDGKMIGYEGRIPFSMYGSKVEYAYDSELKGVRFHDFDRGIGLTEFIPMDFDLSDIY
ncbi:zinc ribbon domain-containing protein [Hutsoniella sourekii]|uniref:zinc ribbon domain-containing protein n=1 Tax=Hutsoniella sourekii TaxID=87650 RepID=UPI0004883AC5|nr:zinc ribbon domain-containing protein [Hutsoniella sourekii]